MLLPDTTTQLDAEGVGEMAIPSLLATTLSLRSKRVPGTYTRSLQPEEAAAEWVIPTATIDLVGRPNARLYLSVERAGMGQVRSVKLDENGRKDAVLIMAGRLSVGTHVDNREWRLDVAAGEAGVKVDV